MISEGFLRPVKKHECGFGSEANYCRVCLSHGLDPANYVRTSVPLIGKIALMLVTSLVAVWAFASVQGCTLAPQRDTNVWEIHHESCTLEHFHNDPKHDSEAAESACEGPSN